MRKKYKRLLCEENLDEDKWTCDICLSKADEEEDNLCICELCLVVVHVNCYKRDLFDDETDDDWLCSRCKYLTKFSVQPS
jgi:hypothetical protein